MTNLELNQTPIRTAKNYGINNIKLENIEIPNEINEFNGLKISGDKEKFSINFEKKENNITYGNGEILKKQIKEKSNQNIQIFVEGNTLKTLELEFKFSKESSQLIDNIVIHTNKNTKSTIIIKYISEDDFCYYHNGQIKVIAEENAKLDIFFINLLNGKANHFQAIENILSKQTDVNYYIVDFGGKNSITNYYSNLQGESSSNKINTIYLGNNNQIIDLNYLAEIYGKKANVQINVKGAITENSKKHFKGTIDFKTGCKKAKGSENEYCTILSENAKAIALPMLLCTEEDVEGEHSTAAGKIDPKQLFYIMSRGLSSKEAQKLIVKASFNEFLKKIDKQELKEKIEKEIDKKI